MLGAQVIEKHFTLDKSLPGPDQKASLDPTEFKAMVDAVRHVEAALGDGHKHLTASEAPNKAIARKSIVAAHAIKAGDVFTEEKPDHQAPRGWHFPRCAGTRFWARPPNAILPRMKKIEL